MKRVVISLSFSFLCMAPLHAQRPVHALDTLRVTVGSRASAELTAALRSVEILTAEDIERMPARSVQDVLARALGVDISARSPAQADIAVRGGSFEQVLVLIDGQPVSDVQTGHFDLDLTVPLHEVERIEVLRGPASAQYGANALGGVVNIVTRKPGATGVRGSAEAGSFQARALAASGSAGVGSVRIGGTAEYRQSDGHRTGTDYRILTSHVTLAAPVRSRALRATLGYAERDFGASKFYTSPASNFDEFEATRALNVHVAWDAPSSQGFAIEPRAAVRRHDDDFVLRRDDPQFYRNVHTTWQLGGELTARYTTRAVRVAVGGTAYQDLLESTNLGDRDESRTALFADAGVGRVGHALGSAGVRIDRHSAYGAFAAPSIAGAVWLTRAVHARASVGRAFRAPTWTDRYYSDPANTGNPSLAPERAWEGEAGVELRTERVHASLGGYIRRTTSLIDWARPAGSDPTVRWQTMNIEEATFRGLEFGLRAIDGLGTRWTVRASGLGFDAAEAEGYESKYALRPLTRQVALEAHRHIPGGVDGFVSTAHVRRAGEAAHNLVDARLSRQVGAARMFIDATNIGNAAYLDAAGMRARGRAFHAGLEWRWSPR